MKIIVSTTLQSESATQKKVKFTDWWKWIATVRSTCDSSGMDTDRKVNVAYKNKKVVGEWDQVKNVGWLKLN